MRVGGRPGSGVHLYLHLSSLSAPPRTDWTARCQRATALHACMSLLHPCNTPMHTWLRGSTVTFSDTCCPSLSPLQGLQAEAGGAAAAAVGAAGGRRPAAAGAVPASG